MKPPAQGEHGGRSMAAYPRTGSGMPARWSGTQRWQVVVVIGLFVLLAPGCSLLPVRPSGEKSPATAGGKGGSLMVAASVSSMSGGDLGEAAAIITVSKDNQQLRQTLSIVEGKVTASIPDLLPGVWQVTLQIADGADDVIYEAQGAVSVLPGAPAALSLILRPRPGFLEVTVDPSSHPDLSMANKARLNVNPGGYASMSDDESGQFFGKKELAAGSYDFNVALYRDGFLVGDRIYESPWITVAISPGKTTKTRWDPVSGNCTIVGELDAPPLAPSGVVLDITAQGLAISWLTSLDTEQDLVQYRVYLRQNVLDKFSLVSEQDHTQSSYVHPDTKLNPGSLIEVVVTAVDAAGQEGPRSEIASLVYQPL